MPYQHNQQGRKEGGLVPIMCFAGNILTTVAAWVAQSRRKSL